MASWSSSRNQQEESDRRIKAGLTITPSIQTSKIESTIASSLQVGPIKRKKIRSTSISSFPTLSSRMNQRDGRSRDLSTSSRHMMSNPNRFLTRTLICRGSYRRKPMRFRSSMICSRNSSRSWRCCTSRKTNCLIVLRCKSSKLIPLRARLCRRKADSQVPHRICPR